LEKNNLNVWTENWSSEKATVFWCFHLYFMG